MSNRTRNDGPQLASEVLGCEPVCDPTANSTARTGDEAQPTLTPDPPSGDTPARDSRGRFARGNRSGLIHGLRTHESNGGELPPEFIHLRDEVQAFVSDCTTDEGGSLTDIPARR